MKKVISLCLIVLLTFSMFGCKRETDTNDTAVNIIENETPSDSTEQATEEQDTKGTEDVTDEAPKTTPEEQPLEDTSDTAPDTDTKTEETEPEAETTPEKEEMTPPYFADVVSPDDEKTIEPYEISIDENFTDDIVMVLIKRGYSAVKQDYTVEDFPYLELDEVEVTYKYYPEDNNRIALDLHLKNPSKQNVIDAINELFKDERIYIANPNWVFSTPADEFFK